MFDAYSTADDKPDNYFSASVQATQSVFDCLVSKDAEGIKALLCDRLKSVADVDEQIQSLLNSIDGSIVPMDMEGRRSVETSSVAKTDGVYDKCYSIGTIRNPATDKGMTYQQLLIFYCYIDVENPDLKGIYSIVLEESESVRYYIHMPKEILDQDDEAEEQEGEYGYIYTPDGQHRPATKEEYDALHGDSAEP